MNMATKILCGVALLVCSCSKKPCDLDLEARERAGANAVDCGRVAIGADRSSTDSCVAQAFQERKPFHARYEAQGIDSRVAWGVIGSASGTVTLLLYDSDPSGGSDVGAVIDARTCEGARLRADGASRNDGAPPFECTSDQVTGRVCG